jgi:hypothetical protein
MSSQQRIIQANSGLRPSTNLIPFVRDLEGITGCEEMPLSTKLLTALINWLSLATPE